MNVTCPDCRTVYRVDPRKVPVGGVRARCARCPADFTVEAIAVLEPGHSLAAESSVVDLPISAQEGEAFPATGYAQVDDGDDGDLAAAHYGLEDGHGSSERSGAAASEHEAPTDPDYASGSAGIESPQPYGADLSAMDEGAAHEIHLDGYETAGVYSEARVDPDQGFRHPGLSDEAGEGGYGDASLAESGDDPETYEQGFNADLDRRGFEVEVEVDPYPADAGGSPTPTEELGSAAYDDVDRFEDTSLGAPAVYETQDNDTAAVATGDTPGSEFLTPPEPPLDSTYAADLHDAPPSDVVPSPEDDSIDGPATGHAPVDDLAGPPPEEYRAGGHEPTAAEEIPDAEGATASSVEEETAEGVATAATSGRESTEYEPIGASAPREQAIAGEFEAAEGFAPVPARSDADLSLPPPPFGASDPHARARRLARALVSDIVVYHRDRRERSVRQGTVRQEFRDEIRKSWEEYVAHVGNPMARDTTYFRDALNEILAGGAKVF